MRITASGGTFTATEQFFLGQFLNQHGGSVLVGDHIYGTGSSQLFCINWKDGTVAWQSNRPGKGSIICVNSLLIVRSEAGKVTLVEANPTEYRERGQFTQPDRSGQRAWSYPVVAGGKLYLRDWDKLLCYDVSAR